MIFSNMPEVELFVNGQSLGKQKTVEHLIFVWENVGLSIGKNRIDIKGACKKGVKTDRVEWFCR